MKTLEELKSLMQDRRVDKMVNATGLSKPTIIAVRDGTAANPAYTTIKALSDYFEAQEQDAASMK